jgi:leader peptidase (prepilin peptidase) / N-methyltransferase
MTELGGLYWGVTAALTAVLCVITVIDLRQHRIPDLLSLPLIVAGLGVAFWWPRLPLQHHLIGAVAGFAVFGAIGGWYYRRTGSDGLGLGDAKLFAAAGAWLGWQSLPMVLLISALGGLGFAYLQRIQDRRAAIAFGPWLALGFWTAWLFRGPGFAAF